MMLDDHLWNDICLMILGRNIREGNKAWGDSGGEVGVYAILTEIVPCIFHKEATGGSESLL